MALPCNVRAFDRSAPAQAAARQRAAAAAARQGVTPAPATSPAAITPSQAAPPGGPSYPWGGPPQSAAQQLKEIESDCENPTYQARYPGPDGTKSFEACVKARSAAARAFAGGSDNDATACQTQASTTSRAIQEFIAACGKAGMSGSLAGCMRDVKSCSECKGEGGEVECDDGELSSTDDTASDVESGLSRAGLSTVDGTTRRSQVAPTRAQASAIYGKCPALALEDMKDYEKEVKEARDKVRELKDKEQEGTDALNAIDNKHTESENTFNNQLQRIRNQAEDQITKIDEGLTETQRKMGEDLQKIESQIDQIKDQMKQVDVQRQSNNVKLNEFKTKEVNRCHQEALTKVNNLRTERLAQMSASQYSAGSFNNLLRTVGLDSRTQSQRLQAQYTNWCLQDRIYLNNQEMAKQQFNVDEQLATSRKTAMERQIARLETQKDIINERLPYEIRRAQEAKDRVQKRLDQEEKNLERQAQNEHKRWQQQRWSKLQSNQRLADQIRIENDYLVQKQDYLATKRRFARGGRASTQEGAVDEAISKYGSALTEMQNFRDMCCQQSGPNWTFKPPNTSMGPTCNERARILATQQTEGVNPDAIIDPSTNDPSRNPAGATPTGI